MQTQIFPDVIPSQRSKHSSIALVADAGDHLKHIVKRTHTHHKEGRELRREHEKGENVAEEWQRMVRYEGVGIYWWDCYLVGLVTLSWFGMILVFIVVIYAQVMSLAAIYWLFDNVYYEDNDGKFKAWNLAIQTYLTIGYGVLTPSPSWWSVIWGFLATSLALVDVAIITGVPYIKFSKPDCAILFSTVATVNMHEGEPTLTIRVANLHNTPIFNLECTMYAVSTGTTIEGISVFRPIQLRMRTESVLVFQHNFVLQHKLDSNSPLYDVWKNLGSSLNEYTQPLNLSLHVTLVGDDAVLQNQVHARHIYHINDFRFDCRFDDMVIPEHVHLGIGKSPPADENKSIIHIDDDDKDDEVYNNELDLKNETMLPPKFVMACNRIDDTVVAKNHITDTVIRKVADAMALHHLGEDMYQKHVSKDHQRYQQSKALDMIGDHGSKIAYSNASGSGSNSKTCKTTAVTEEKEKEIEKNNVEIKNIIHDLIETVIASDNQNQRHSLIQHRKNNTVGEVKKNAKKKSNSLRTAPSPPAGVLDILEKLAVPVSRQNTMRGSHCTYFKRILSMDSDPEHHNLLKTISYQLGAHHSILGNSKKKSKKLHQNKGCCCCSHNVYMRFSRWCFVVKDVEHIRDVRCCCSMNHKECQPNALLKIPQQINKWSLLMGTNLPFITHSSSSLSFRFSELYYQAVKMSLVRLISLVLLIYFLYIFSFGFSIWVANYIQDTTLNYGGETNKTILNLTEFESFRNSFALAHQTISTIGYGHIAPNSDTIHLTVFLFGTFGLIVSSLLVAVIWSRFTAVRPVLAFSTQAVMSKWNGQLALRFKIAGLWRPKPILTGEVTVSAVLSVKGEDGLKMSRLVTLPVEIKYNPLMVLPWTVVHIVNEKSPIYGVTEKNFSSIVQLITTVFSGMDSCTGHEISAMYAYPSKNVVWDHRFATSIDVDPDSGVISVDMFKFHLLRPTKTIYRLALQKKFIKHLKRHVKERKEMDMERRDGVQLIKDDEDVELV